MNRGRKRKDESARELEEQRRRMRRGINLLLDPDKLETGCFDSDTIVRDTLILPEVYSLTAPDASAEFRVVDSAIAVSLFFPPTVVAKSIRQAADLMIARDLPVFMAKVLELFVSELTLRAYLAMKSEDPKRVRISPSDITAGISANSRFDFLRDVLPQDELVTILGLPRV